ncbi:MAG: hypothetical protein H0V44_06875 [Planctomycetes bacterium]|nr:hypothetical protein [Planctomycetota bacterium]
MAPRSATAFFVRTGPADRETLDDFSGYRGSLPFILASSDAGVVVTLASDAGLHEAIAHPQSWEWADTVAGHVVIDASRLRMMNSPLCGWLVNLMRACGSRRLLMTGANARVRETLRLLKLDTLIPVVA